MDVVERYLDRERTVTNKIAKKLKTRGIKVSGRTVRRYAKDLQFEYKIPKRKPLITKKNKRSLSFC